MESPLPGISHSLNKLEVPVSARVSEQLPPEKTSTSLLDLPGDVRNIIYNFAIVHHEDGGVITPCMRCASEGPKNAGPFQAVVQGEKSTDHALKSCLHTFRDRPHA